MNLLDAVAKVLADAGEPLHYREITRLLLEQGLWGSQGKTPAATVNARLAVDIKRHPAASRFCRVGPGVFALKGDVADKSMTPKPGVTVESTPTLSFTEAAVRVLEQFGQRKPMHYREITEKALGEGLIATEGKTPEATMYAQILTEIQRKTRRGERPRFVKHGKGYVGLSKWMGKGLAFQIEQHNRDVRKQLLQRVRKMDPAEFEALIGRLLTALGFDSVSVTGVSRDGGIDVRGTLVVGDVIATRMAVQAKRWRQNVRAPVVQQLRGSLRAHERGLIISTSDFSGGAREEAGRSDALPIGLMNGEQLVNLLIENSIGVERLTHDVIELAEEDEDA